MLRTAEMLEALSKSLPRDVQLWSRDCGGRRGLGSARCGRTTLPRGFSRLEPVNSGLELQTKRPVSTFPIKKLVSFYALINSRTF